MINTFLFGGAQKMVLDLATYLDKNKFAVTVCSLRQDDLKTNKYYDAQRVAAQHGFDFVAMSDKRNTLVRIYDLFVFLRKVKPDIVHCHLPWSVILGVIAARLAGIRQIIIHEHNTHKFYSFKVRWLTKILRKFVRLTICYSPEVEQEIFSRCNFFSSATEKLQYNSYTIFNGVDLEGAKIIQAKIDLEAKRQSLGTDAGKTVVLSVARLLPWKGQANLIRALAIALKEIKNLVLLIAGGGIEEPNLRQLAKDLGLNNDQVIFLGPRGDVPEILAVIDIFSSVLSYPPDFSSESIGLSTLEAMAFALPVIVGDYQGVEKIIQDKVNGLVLAPNDKQQLAEAIIDLAKNLVWRQTLGNGARALIAEKFSWSQISLIYQNLYNLIAKN